DKQIRGDVSPHEIHFQVQRIYNPDSIVVALELNLDMTTAEPKESLDFIRTIIEEDLASKKHRGKVITRFHPEPNGHLHTWPTKPIRLNFGVAKEYGGRTNLRFDDTNPIKEEQEYIDGIKNDVRWLGFDWGEHEYYASDYFEQLYEWAVLLIRRG